MSDHTLVLEHPELGGYHATVETHFYGPACGAHRLVVVDDEGDVVLDYLNRMDPPELRLAKIQNLLCEYGFTVPNESE
ncbi:MAG: hypothetical protein QF619_09160 [Candidatus Binatia bacterium]|nr:hypothetical protein [Candidatus Binatia bacterium]